MGQSAPMETTNNFWIIAAVRFIQSSDLIP
jgi:hypothetical protein